MLQTDITAFDYEVYLKMVDTTLICYKWGLYMILFDFSVLLLKNKFENQLCEIN